jgi:hypothetical protein
MRGGAGEGVRKGILVLPHPPDGAVRWPAPRQELPNGDKHVGLP